MANETSKTPTQAKPQMIPLSKIHELPGVFNPKPQDKSLGSMVLSIESSGVKEPIILRLRDDGEYQLLSGDRRRRASELAKKQDIPAHVYKMTMQEAIAYRKAVKQNPSAPIPGKLIDPNEEKGKTAGAKSPAADEDEKNKKGETPATPGDKAKEDDTPAAPGDKTKESDTPAAPGDKGKSEQPAAPEKGKEGDTPAAPGGKAKEDDAPAAPSDKAKEDDTPAAPGEKAKEGDTPAVPGDKAKEGDVPASPGDKDRNDIPTVAELEARAKAGERISLTDLAAASKAEREAKAKEAQPAAPEKNKEAKTAPSAAGEGEALTAASEGPSATAITQVLEKRLTPPDEASWKSIPKPDDGESYFITLHPAYLEKSIFNKFSVDVESENFKELMKSVELVGIKDPVLARFNPEGKLEILSGQRRHMIATMLNTAVPTIIQKIDDADAKIIVADGNLHRDKISSYDLSRALRMKMEGMKQKAGRRKKGYTANELQSDAKLAQEMGMSVAKLNRYIRMSEAVKGVCDLVDDGKLTVSVAAEMSSLKPKTQEGVLHLLDLGYKATNERISRMKKAEAGGNKLDDMELRKILDDKDIAPKQPEPVQHTEAPAVPAPGAVPDTSGASVPQPTIPASPDVPPSADIPSSEADPTQGQNTPQTPSNPSETAKEDDPFKGEQERPEVTKVILTGDRLRKYFPDVSMTPREIEESVYSALEERRQRQLREQQKAAIFKKNSGPSH